MNDHDPIGGERRDQDSSRLGIVVIGRNEGGRLIRCFESLPNSASIVYVDSGSTDGSVRGALARHIDVVELDVSMPFTAARARNAGFRRLLEIAPDRRYVQFVDGDCEVAEGWPQRAIRHLDRNVSVCAVFGRLREAQPSRSIYNKLCDMEWDIPIGIAKTFGGIFMIRTEVFTAAGGFRDDLIAGEEPELCVRLRSRGWTIERIEGEMALHDAAMTKFSQWWRRQLRCGLAFAEGAHIHGSPPERHWVHETRRAAVWGLVTPAVCASISVLFPPWGFAAWLVYPMQMLRLFLTRPGQPRERALLAVFHVLSRFPEGQGYLKFVARRFFGQRLTTIEYK
ncbi:glycosyltransferase family 2 protein [Bradyrhizobium lablabi]|uniref:glycosyltransferase family 2 protein n=1 Tax=Bradyrhizobium lablabi TaxID=722472 RepID=UPI001BA866B8|nr:glycosyltransferase [Bradyrhizobium lablabi]MBR0697783.1 glycosyltransferase family 2 protein [Bradyrhizobium lablabi]